MAQTGYGSVDKPVSLDHYQNVIGVNWGGQRVGILEMSYVPGTSFVEMYDSSDVDVANRYNAGDTVKLIDDIKDDWMVKTLVSHDDGPWRAENEIVSWIADYRVTTRSPNSADYDQDDFDGIVAAGDSFAGYHVKIQAIGGSPVFNLQTTSEPDGAHYSVYNGYTIKNPWWFFTDYNGNKDPSHEFDNIMYDYSALDNNGINDWSMVLVWYHEHTRPPVDYEKLKQNWLVNFSPGKSNVIAIYTGNVFCEYRLRIFRAPVKATFNSDGTVTVLNMDNTPAVPAFLGNGSQAGGPKYFNSAGFVAV